MRSAAVTLLVVAASLSGCVFEGEEARYGHVDPGAGVLYGSYLAGSSERVILEIDHEPGAYWDTTTPVDDHVVQQIERITQKEVLVRAQPDLNKQDPEHEYTSQELEALHEDNLDARPDNRTEVIHGLFVEGKNGSRGGLAFAPRAFALFEGRIEEVTCPNDTPTCRSSCPGQPVCREAVNESVRKWKLMRSVAIHEAGHLFGLVANPLPMVEDHEMNADPRPETKARENRSHSSNRSSVMFWTNGNPPDRMDYLDGGETSWRFGEQDLEDARALQRGR